MLNIFPSEFLLRDSDLIYHLVIIIYFFQGIAGYFLLKKSVFEIVSRWPLDVAADWSFLTHCNGVFVCCNASGRRIASGALASAVSKLWIINSRDDDVACSWTWQFLIFRHISWNFIRFPVRIEIMKQYSSFCSLRYQFCEV